MTREELKEFVAEKRVMHSFLPDDDERTKNEYVADELIAAGFVNEVTDRAVGRAWVALALRGIVLDTPTIRAALEATFTSAPVKV